MQDIEVILWTVSVLCQSYKKKQLKCFQVGLAPISWTLLFPVVALPCLSLLLSVGRLSNSGPVLTYKRIAPIASGQFDSPIAAYFVCSQNNKSRNRLGPDLVRGGTSVSGGTTSCSERTLLAFFLSFSVLLGN